MNYYIFVVNDLKINRKTESAQRVYDTLMNRKEWLFHIGAKQINILGPGDKIVFYQAGIEGKKFLGTAVIQSKPQRVETRRLGFDYRLVLAKIHKWRKPKLATDFVEKLEFIRNKKNWGFYLMGSIRKISQRDFKTIAG